MKTITQRFHLQLALQLLSQEQQQQLRNYLRVTDYGQRYISPRQQYELARCGELPVPEDWNWTTVFLPEALQSENERVKDRRARLRRDVP